MLMLNARAFPCGMSSIVVAVLLILLAQPSEPLAVEVPQGPVVAPLGSSVTLPCWISPPEDATALEIRWYRHEHYDQPVLHYQQRALQPGQEPEFRNRSALTLRSPQSKGLAEGDVSLRIDRVRVQDEAPFHCYVSGESDYGTKELQLTVTAVGSEPVLFPRPLSDGGVNVSCSSSGWYPQPSVSWTGDERRVLRPGGSAVSRGTDGTFSIHSWTTVSPGDAALLSCSVSLPSGEKKEGRMNTQALGPSDSSGPWKALFLTLLFLALVAVAVSGLILYKHKLTGKKPTDQNCEAGPKVELKRTAGEDVNLDDLRKHADQITIDRENLNADLRVTADGKILRDRGDYKCTEEGFPYELCAFGSQGFTSSRHFWEVALAAPSKPAKDYWMIGVVKQSNYTSRDRSSLTPSQGYWFLCSDGPRGFYINTEPPVTLPVTPRPERLGVLLDYEGGQLSFYDTKEKKHLLTMSSRFTGSIVPLFNPGAGDLSPIKILDCPDPEETPVESPESCQPLLGPALPSSNSTDA